jgi:hypothetical protein
MADLTYLANADLAGGTDTFYALAKQYFTANGSTVVDAPAQGQTIEGILADLASRGALQETVNIVCRATGLGALAMPLTLADQAAGRGFANAEDVENALSKKSLVPPGQAIVDDTTRLVLYGGDLGRSMNLMLLLSGLFGNPGELLAPRRLSVFMLDGSNVLYRQAQTWTRVSKAPLVPEGANEPAGGWAAFRTQFVSDVSARFAPIAAEAGDAGGTQLTAQLTTAANSATLALAPSFFFEAGFDIGPSATQTTQQVAVGLPSMPNGDPVTAAAASPTEVDDTALVTPVSGTDAFAADVAQTRYEIRVVMLAQLIDQEVPIAEGPAYARVTSSQGLAGSLGPGSGGGSGSGASDLQLITAELVANGVPQAQIDELFADVPPEAAPDDANADAAGDSPDAVPIAGDPDFPMPEVDVS